MGFAKLVLHAPLALALGACTGITDITGAEIATRTAISDGPITTYAAAVDYGVRLTEDYIRLSGRSETADIAASLGIIGTTAYAAYRAVGGAGTTELARLAVTGLTASQVAGLLDAKGRGSALLSAAAQINCIVKAANGQAADLSGGGALKDDAVAAILAGYQTARVNLRRALQSKPIDLAKLRDQYAAAIKKNAATPDVPPGTARLRRSALERSAAEQKAFAALQEQIAACPFGAG